MSLNRAVKMLIFVPFPVARKVTVRRSKPSFLSRPCLYYNFRSYFLFRDPLMAANIRRKTSRSYIPCLFIIFGARSVKSEIRTSLLAPDLEKMNASELFKMAVCNVWFMSTYLMWGPLCFNQPFSNLLSFIVTYLYISTFIFITMNIQYVLPILFKK